MYVIIPENSNGYIKKKKSLKNVFPTQQQQGKQFNHVRCAAFVHLIESQQFAERLYRVLGTRQNDYGTCGRLQYHQVQP